MLGFRMKKSRHIPRRAQRTGGGPLEFQEEHAFVAHVARAVQERVLSKNSADRGILDAVSIATTRRRILWLYASSTIRVPAGKENGFLRAGRRAPRVRLTDDKTATIRRPRRASWAWGPGGGCHECDARRCPFLALLVHQRAASRSKARHKRNREATHSHWLKCAIQQSQAMSGKGG